eukprot:scaffold105355_cov48-Phaeocystis_antarctica.AAC.2
MAAAPTTVDQPVPARVAAAWGPGLAGRAAGRAAAGTAAASFPGRRRRRMRRRRTSQRARVTASCPHALPPRQ